jgi:hypothetical protein
MLDTLRGRLSHAERVRYFRPRGKPENAQPSPAFFVLSGARGWARTGAKGN